MTIQTSRKENIIITLLLFLTFVLLTANIYGYEGDTRCWRDWALDIQRGGLANVYQGGTNYMPFYHYLLFLFGKMAGTTENIEKYISSIRIFTLLFDFAGIYLVYRWTHDRLSYLAVLLFTMLNFGYTYNTLIWNQVDGILATLFFASLFFIKNRMLVLSAVFMILSLNMKLQALALMPLWGILVLFSIVANRRWWLMLTIPLVMIATQFLILVPFGLQGSKGLWTVVQSAVGSYPRISLSAYNIWNLLLGNVWANQSDSQLWAGLPFRQWGLILFIVSSFFALFPLLKIIVLKLRGKLTATEIPKEIIWVSAALIALLFFFCNTEMHERYCHQVLIFIAAYSLYSRRYWPYFLFSLAYFLNLEGVMKYFKFNNYGTVVFDQQFVALIFLAVLVLLYYDLYKMHRKFLPGGSGKF